MIRKLVLKLMGMEDYHRFDKFLSSHDSVKVRDSVKRNFSPDVDDRLVWPRVYTECENKGVAVRGWKLRFLMYYWAGHYSGDW